MLTLVFFLVQEMSIDESSDDVTIVCLCRTFRAKFEQGS